MPLFDFNGTYGVAVENNTIQAPVPEVYVIPAEEEFFDEEDEIVSVEELPEEAADETPETSEETPA